MTAFAKRLAADESGASSVEYAILAVCLGVPLLAASTPIRTALVTLLGSVAEQLGIVLAEK
jgi:Flp pilus assembly pilin Flp